MAPEFIPALEDLSPDQRAVYDTLPIDLTRGLLMTRSSAVPYLSLGRSFHDGWLTAPVRELVILRVGAVTGTAYELFYHVPQARACGVPDDTIDKVLARSDRVGSADLDALMLFVDRLVAGAHGDPPDVGIVEGHYSRDEIAEIVLLVGHYLMTSLFVKTLGIQPEAERSAPPTIER